MDEKTSNDQIEKLRRYVAAAEESLAGAKKALAEIDGGDVALKPNLEANAVVSDGGKIIEGVFDGENMIGSENKMYPVPVNYASKSKLVVGDRLKLTVAEDGSFIFKQIGPVERNKLVGTLNFENNAYHVLAEGKSYNVLHASVTYYKAKPGDKLTIVVPKESHTNWATIENVIHDVAVTEEPVLETGLMEEGPRQADILDDVKIPEEVVAPEPEEVFEAPTPAAPEAAPETQIFEPMAEAAPAERAPGAPVIIDPGDVFNQDPNNASPTEDMFSSPAIKSETTEAPQPLAETPAETVAPGSAMPEESFLPRTQDEESNSLGEKAPSAWDTAAGSATPVAELDI